MSPVTHGLIGWLAANAGKLERKERTAVVVAGIIPDLDAAGIIAEKLTANSDKPLLWWSKYHHVFGHNLIFGIIVAVACFFITKRNWKVALLALLSFHLHLLGDVIGGKGPDGFQWPIPYFYPFFQNFTLVWSGQWMLNAWQNFVITGSALAAAFYLAWKRGYSPVGIFSVKADKAFVKTLRNRFPVNENQK